MARARLRIAVGFAALAGLAATIFLVTWFGAPAILAALAAIGPRGLVVLAALHLIVMAICGLAWRSVMPPGESRPLPIVTAARILRDAGSELLPISPAGGAVMGARALMLAHIGGSGAFASTVVDITMELMAQLAFTAIGIVALIHGGWAPELGRPAVVGLAIAAAAAFGFVLAQRIGLFLLLERLTARLATRDPALRPPDGRVHDAIRAIYRQRGGVVVGFGCHFAAWLATTIEAWVALRLIGVPLPFAAIVVLESLAYAIRSAAFFVPSGWGIQEGGYVLLGAIVGLSPTTALALSLAKRGRELAIGVPALLLWQALEARIVRRAPS